MHTQSRKLRFHCQSGRCNLFSFAHRARVKKAVYCAKLRYSNRMDRQRRFSYTAKCKCKVLEFVLERRKNGLPVTGDIIREKVNEVARARNIQRHVFKANRGWVDCFMRCNGLSLRRCTAICQKLPTDFEEKLMNCQQHLIMQSVF